ncbi:MAG: PDZ domain-containing protein [Prosthecobacter sp.]|nr:PDZ domain-containing protein [Prosthecobacter sp.]
MNPIHALMLFMAGLLALINSPLSAQEKPAEKPSQTSPSETPQPPQPPPARTEAEKPDKPRGERPRTTPPADEKPTSFIGVLTANASPELRAQFGLQEGFGLQVIEVMPDSPAKAAGLKEHDLLLNFDDQKLVSMEQLQALVRSKKKDDLATFTVISGGKQAQVPVKIGERMMSTRQEERRNPSGRFFPMNPGDPGRPENFRPGHEMQETLERFQQRMREYQERLQEWNRNGHQGRMPTPPMLDGPRTRDSDRREVPQPPNPPGTPGIPRTPDAGGSDRGPRSGDPRHEERRSSSTSTQQSASVTRRDDSGTYTLRRDNDHSIFTVRTNDGKEQTWSFTSETERTVVPEQYRDKLRMLQEVSSDMHRDGHPRNPGLGGDGPGPGRGDGDRRPAPEGRRQGEAPPRDAPSPKAPPGRPKDTF